MRSLESTLISILFLLFLIHSCLARRAGICTPTVNSTFWITTQQDLDNFYFGCSIINGSLDIRCNQTASTANRIYDLEVFQYVTDIKGYLRIQNCEYLTSLAGLSALQRISGNDLYKTAADEEGFAVYVSGNTALESLHGLQNLEYIKGKEQYAKGRVSITSNANLCYTDQVNWQSVLGDSWERVLSYTTATARSCTRRTCDSSCSCGTCFGPYTVDCQGVCKNEKRERDILIVCIVVPICFFLLLFLIYMWVTKRCGCKTRFYDKYYQLGTVPSLNGRKSQATLSSSTIQRQTTTTSRFDPFNDTEIYPATVTDNTVGNWMRSRPANPRV